MKTKQLFLSFFVMLMATAAWADVEINETTFPDENFRRWVKGQSYGMDGVLKDEEIADVTYIWIDMYYKEDIRSLKGIEYFTALTSLSCYETQLTALDVSKNTKLINLNCDSNKLKTLNVSGCSALKELSCVSNELTTLDVSGCTALTKLTCYKNKIKLTGMDALVESLPTVSFGRLEVIYYQNEQNVMTVSQVAVAKAKGWTPYYYGYDSSWGWHEYAGSDIAINEDYFPDANFRKYLLNQDFGRDGVLKDEEIASVKGMSVSSYNIQDLKGIEFFTELKQLTCSSNILTSLDLSKNTKLTKLDCRNNRLTALNVSNNTELTELDCYGSNLTELDLSNNTKLTSLDCSQNELTALDCSKNTVLKTLYCYGNQLASLDLSQNTALTTLNCTNNQLTALDLSQNTALTTLICTNNQLTALDLSKNTALKKLKCYNNQLTALDVSGCTTLEELDCCENQLTALDVSKNTALTELYCDKNKLGELDMSNCSALEYLACYGNKLTMLDMSHNTELTGLDCHKNKLKALNVSKNTALKKLHCYDNQLATLDVSGCAMLTQLYCYKNIIKVVAMDALVKSLPTVTSGTMDVINNEGEGNVMTTTQVAAARAKGWTPLYYDGSQWKEYAGSEPVTPDFATLTYSAGSQSTLQMPVKTGEVTLCIKAEENWAVESLTVNGDDKLADLNGDNLILNVESDTEVRVAFRWANAETLYFEDYATGIATIAGEDVKVYVIDGQLCVEGAVGKEVRLYTVGGALIKTVTPQDGDKVGVFRVPAETYIVQVGSKAAKVIVR